MSGTTLVNNFDLQSKKPNFDRDTFETLAEMRSYPENSIDELHVSACLETGKRYKFQSSNTKDSVTGKWRMLLEEVNEEDFLIDNNGMVLFKDRGVRFLRKNIVEEVNVLTQNMFSDTDTAYLICYDFNLNGATIDLPERSVLLFQGGSIQNGTLNGNNSRFAGLVNFGADVSLTGNWENMGTVFPARGRFKGDFFFDETGGSLNVWNGSSWESFIKGVILTQSEYEAISKPVVGTMYFIKG